VVASPTSAPHAGCRGRTSRPCESSSRRRQRPVGGDTHAPRAAASRASARVGRPPWWGLGGCWTCGNLLPRSSRGPGFPAVHGTRAVAQLGSAPDWGSGGRRFKSCQPDSVVSQDIGMVGTADSVGSDHAHIQSSIRAAHCTTTRTSRTFASIERHARRDVESRRTPPTADVGQSWPASAGRLFWNRNRFGTERAA
jgi:hypothetical protein